MTPIHFPTPPRRILIIKPSASIRRRTRPTRRNSMSRRTGSIASRSAAASVGPGTRSKTITVSTT
jgi:hypothetical protein